MLWGRHMLVGHELNSYYIIMSGVFAVKAIPVFSDFDVQLFNYYPNIYRSVRIQPAVRWLSVQAI